MKSIDRFFISFAMLVFLLVMSFVGSAVAGDAGAKVGILTCKDVPGKSMNFIIHSKAKIKCKFKGADGAVEYYKGETGIGLGLDLKFKRDFEITFTVLAAQFHSGSHQLAGKYTGGSASVTAGAGVGAHALVGGSGKSISLRPAVEESEGYALAAGLGYMILEPARKR